MQIHKFDSNTLDYKEHTNKMSIRIKILKIKVNKSSVEIEEIEVENM